MFRAVSNADDPRTIASAAYNAAVSLRPDDVAAGVLALVPPDLRKARFDVDFGGFAGGAVVVLAGKDEIRRGLANVPPAASDPGGDTIFQPRVGRRRDEPRRAGAPDPRDLFRGRELEGFTLDDLDALDPLPAGARLSGEDLRPALVRLLLYPPQTHEPLAEYLVVSMSQRGREVLAELESKP